MGLRGLAVAMVLACAVTVLAEPAARAGTVSTEWSCTTGAGGWLETYTVSVTAPATATRGDTVTLSATVTGSRPQPGPRPAGYFSNGSLGLTVHGAATARVTVTGMTSPAANDRDPYRLVGGSARLTVNAAGTVTLSPDNAGFPLTGYPGFGLGCSDYDGVLPVAAGIQIP